MAVFYLLGMHRSMRKYDMQVRMQVRMMRVF